MNSGQCLFYCRFDFPEDKIAPPRSRDNNNIARTTEDVFVQPIGFSNQSLDAIPANSISNSAAEGHPKARMLQTIGNSPDYRKGGAEFPAFLKYTIELPLMRQSLIS